MFQFSVEMISPSSEAMLLGNECTTKKYCLLLCHVGWLWSLIWVTPRQGRWGGGGPPRWQRRHGPHERRVVGAFSGAWAGRVALYSGPLVCRAGPAVILVSIHGSVAPTEVVERQAGTQCVSSRARTVRRAKKFSAPSKLQRIMWNPVFLIGIINLLPIA